MVAAARTLLELRGLNREQIHADPFLTNQSPGAGAAARKVASACASPVTTAATAGLFRVPQLAKAQTEAGVWDYLKYLLIHAQAVVTSVALLAGGWAPTLWLLAFLAMYMVGDELFGDDLSTPRYRFPRIMTAQLWLVLPLLAMSVFVGIWSVSLGDPLDFGAWVTSWSGYDVLKAKANAVTGQYASALLLTAWMISIFGIVPGHELIHRPWDPISSFIGRWLLAFSGTIPTMIQHVYKHHRLAATYEDPDTAPRGRNVYTHIWIAFIQGNLWGWRVERQRLQRKGYATLSWRNAAIRGHLMSLSLLTLAWLLGGWSGALFLTFAALVAFAQLEIVAYSQHYGLVRQPAAPIQLHHSWNCNRRISTWGFLNLPRHSYHHAQGEASYQDLQPCADAPMMVGGYITNIALTLIPPLWHYLMTPKLLEWDRHYATLEERKLAAQANARSGIAALMADAELWSAAAKRLDTDDSASPLS
jgi:alkane 1-monooxygenase